MQKHSRYTHRLGLAAAALFLAGATTAHADDDAKAAYALAQQHNCMACHGIDHKIVGPAYQEVAKHYADDKGAADTLLKKVQTGGAGTWGQIPMPPQSAVAEGDLKKIIHWILAGAKTE